MLVGKSLSPGFWVPEKNDQDGEDDIKAGSDKCVPISCHPGIKKKKQVLPICSLEHISTKNK